MNSMSDREYVQNDGRICPFCHHNVVVGEDFVMDGTCVTMKVTCNNHKECGLQWTDRYELVGYSGPNQPQSDTDIGPESYPDLYQAAQTAQQNWEAKQAVDWQEAEDLVAMLRNLEPDHRLEPMVSEILNYCANEEEWDSGKADQWPALIIGSLSTTSAGLILEQIDDEWQVLNLRLSGKKERVASFSAENLAIVFMSFYQ